MFIEFAISKGLLSEQRMPQGPLSLNLLYQPCQYRFLLASDFGRHSRLQQQRERQFIATLLSAGTLKSLIFA